MYLHVLDVFILTEFYFNSQAVALYKSVLEYKTNWKITINIDAWGNELPKNCLGVKSFFGTDFN